MSKQLSNDELVALWHPDGDSAGWASEAIAYELARRLKPAGYRELFDFFYPGTEPKDVDQDLREMIDWGVLHFKNPTLWETKKRALILKRASS